MVRIFFILRDFMYKSVFLIILLAICTFMSSAKGDVDLKYAPDLYPQNPYVYNDVGHTKESIQSKLVELLNEPKEFFKVLNFF